MRAWMRTVMARYAVSGALIGVLVITRTAPVALGHETDQFSSPPAVPGQAEPAFADIGPVVDRWMHRIVEEAVHRTNRRIRRCALGPPDPALLAVLQRPDEVIKNLNATLPRSIELINRFEHALRSRRLAEQFEPGRVIAYRAHGAGVYGGSFLLPDLRGISHLFLSSTVQIHGVYAGTDKLGHFTDIGIAYYWSYVKAIRDGASEAQAIERAVAVGTDGLLSENGFLGLAGTGCYSNADLAANFAGMMFYRNLTEPVVINGRTLPPMLRKQGLYWRFAAHMGPNRSMLAPFVSDHWDEALNPNLYDRFMRRNLRKAIRARGPALIRRYANRDRQLASAAQFARLQQELQTYYGIDYGHRGRPQELIQLASTCFDTDEAHATGHVSQPTMLMADGQ